MNSKSEFEAVVVNREKVASPVQVGEENLPPVEEEEELSIYRSIDVPTLTMVMIFRL